MLARYRMYRGKRPAADPLPRGTRMDTRWHTTHPLRPTQELASAFLAAPSDKTWRAFRAAYCALLEQRFREDLAAFDELARQARDADVFLGCSCPTRKNPRVDRCHTHVALQFMKRKYPDLQVEFPPLPKA